MSTLSRETSAVERDRSRVLLVGVGVALAGVAALLIPSAGFSVTDDIPVETMVAKLDDAQGSLALGGGLQALVAMGVVLYGALVRRVLLARDVPEAVTPTVAWGGSLLTASMIAMAGAHTQLASWDDAPDPAILLTLHTLAENLYAGAWCSLALVAGAIAVAGFRRGAVQRWLAGLSAFVAVLLVLAQLVVPWAAWFPALVWLAVSAIALHNLSR